MAVDLPLFFSMASVFMGFVALYFGVKILMNMIPWIKSPSEWSFMTVGIAFLLMYSISALYKDVLDVSYPAFKLWLNVILFSGMLCTAFAMGQFYNVLSTGTKFTDE
jgi:hypothetical protein